MGQTTQNMDISCVILTWNSERFIGKCLAALFDDLNGSRFSYEIFIVDNGSKDSTVQIISSFKDKHPNHIIPIYLEKNTGTTYSRNLALKKAIGEYIIIMDSDVEISNGTIEKLIKTLDESENTGIVAPKILYPNGNLQKSTDDFPTILTKIYRYFFLRSVEKYESFHNSEEGIREVDYAISAMWMLRREVIDKIGLLDENIFYAPEDVDYCLRIWKAGYKILCHSGVSCIHHTQEISRGIKINIATIKHIQGLFYYFRKHKYLFKRPKDIRTKKK